MSRELPEGLAVPEEVKDSLESDKSLLAKAEYEAGKLQAIAPKASRLRNHWGLTEKQEAFAQEFAKSKDIRSALVRAGYSVSDLSIRWHQKGKALLAKPKIAKRVQQLDEMAAVSVNMTRDIYHSMLLDHRKRALEVGDYAAANRAMELLGKSLSYLAEGPKESKNLHLHAHTADPDRVARLEGLAKLLNKNGSDGS